MSDTIETKLAELNITLPTPAAAVASYLPYVISGNQLFISGQLPMQDGAVAFTGKLGKDVDLETGQQAALLCAINILAQAKAAVGGDWSKIKRIVRLGGFVQSADDFFDQAKVMNGASDFMQSVLGEDGRHARAAVGTNALPLNAAVEVDAIIELAA